MLVGMLADEKKRMQIRVTTKIKCKGCGMVFDIENRADIRRCPGCGRLMSEGAAHGLRDAMTAFTDAYRKMEYDEIMGREGFSPVEMEVLENGRD